MAMGPSPPTLNSPDPTATLHPVSVFRLLHGHIRCAIFYSFTHLLGCKSFPFGSRLLHLEPLMIRF